MQKNRSTRQKEMIILTDVSLITCIVQKGMSDQVVAAARAAGAQGAAVHFSRGAGVRERLGLLSITVEAEKEIIQVMVSKQQQEEIFSAMFSAGKIDVPGMGIIFVTHLEKAAAYIPKEVLERVKKNRLLEVEADG